MPDPHPTHTDHADQAATVWYVHADDADSPIVLAHQDAGGIVKILDEQAYDEYMADLLGPDVDLDDLLAHIDPDDLD